MVRKGTITEMASLRLRPELPIPAFYDPARVGQIWKVPYQQRAGDAAHWAKQHDITPARPGDPRICLIGIDLQNTFCLPDFELYVAGRSGHGAVDDSRRLAEFIYRNLANLSEIALTMDTHQAVQIFHAVFLVGPNGEHPQPNTLVSAADVEQGRWRFNPAVAPTLGVSAEYGQQSLLHYTRQLAAHGKYDLTIWPYHAMLGGIGHALVPTLEEATFFYSLARMSQVDFTIKGEHTFTENYSAIGPEVRTGVRGELLGRRENKFIEKVQRSDLVIIAGQAKSHCVAWTIADLLTDLQSIDPSLARKIYLLEDCTSAVVVPGVVDYTADADAAFAGFARAGMHLVQSTEAIAAWPGVK